MLVIYKYTNICISLYIYLSNNFLEKEERINYIYIEYIYIS